MTLSWTNNNIIEEEEQEEEEEGEMVVVQEESPALLVVNKKKMMDHPLLHGGGGGGYNKMLLLFVFGVLFAYVAVLCVQRLIYPWVKRSVLRQATAAKDVNIYDVENLDYVVEKFFNIAPQSLPKPQPSTLPESVSSML
jgi:hypothetical protein